MTQISHFDTDMKREIVEILMKYREIHDESKKLTLMISKYHFLKI